MKSLCAFLVACLSLLSPTLANAQLTLTLDKPDQFGFTGDTLAYTGTLSNPTSTLIFLSGDSFSLDLSGATLDDSPFLDNAPVSLDAGQSFAGLLFNVSLGPGTPSKYVPSTFIIRGGANEGDQNSIASAQFTVTANAPEPSSAALILGALTLACPGVIRRVGKKGDF